MTGLSRSDEAGHRLDGQEQGANMLDALCGSVDARMTEFMLCG